MGNFTSIEQEFNARIVPEINKITQIQSTAGDPQIVQNKINEAVQKHCLKCAMKRCRRFVQ